MKVAKVNGEFWIKTNALSKHELNEVRAELTYHFDVFNHITKKFDNIKTVLQYRLEEEDDVSWLVVPRWYGLDRWGRRFSRFMQDETVDGNSLDIDILEDREREFFNEISQDVRIDVEQLKKIQHASTEEFWRKLNKQLVAYHGCYSAFTRFGKMNICFHLLFKKIRRRALIVCNNLDMIESTKNRLLKYTSIAEDRIGEVRANKIKFEGKDIVLTTIQSMCNDYKRYVRGEKMKYPNKFYNSFGCIVFDEAHLYGGDTWYKVSSLFPARYRLAFTATPKDDHRPGRFKEKEVVVNGVSKPLNKWVLISNANGDVLVKIKRRKDNFIKHGWEKLTEKLSKYSYKIPTIYEASSFSFVSDVYFVKTKGRYEVGVWPYQNAFDVVCKRLMNDHERNSFCINYFIQCLKKDRKAIVYTCYREHVSILYDEIKKRLKSLGLNFCVAKYLGGMKAEEYEAARECDLIIATYEAASVGITIPDLTNDFYVLPSRDPDITQPCGRKKNLFCNKKQTQTVFFYDDVYYIDHNDQKVFLTRKYAEYAKAYFMRDGDRIKKDIKSLNYFLDRLNVSLYKRKGN